MQWAEIATQDKIQKEVRRLGKQIKNDYKDKVPICAVCILKGAFPFFSDIVRSISLEMSTEFIFASSYRDSEEPDEIEINASSIGDITNRHVLIIDDIYDTGMTLESVKIELSCLRPASIKTCALLVKENPERIIEPDYFGFQVDPEGFYVGYGMDYKGLGRNLPFIVSKPKGEQLMQSLRKSN